MRSQHGHSRPAGGNARSRSAHPRAARPGARVVMRSASLAARPRMGAIDPTAATAAFEDSDSDAWLHALKDGGPGHDRAVERLHALLLRGARFEVSRRRASLSFVRGEDLDDIATQAADDALVAV